MARIDKNERVQLAAGPYVLSMLSIVSSLQVITKCSAVITRVQWVSQIGITGWKHAVGHQLYGLMGYFLI